MIKKFAMFLICAFLITINVIPVIGGFNVNSTDSTTDGFYESLNDELFDQKIYLLIYLHRPKQ